MNPAALIFLFVALSAVVFGDKSFVVDYENDQFLKDGKPFRYVSGSIHYFRVPYQLWGDRLQKMKMAGLNAIQTYVEWNHHEPEPGVYYFDYNYDLVSFLLTAQATGLLVILRTGPFIDAERDMGGLPYWLLRIDPDMKLRTYDENYIKYVDRWYSVLLPMIRPLLYENGGPVIMIQVENEYGSTGLCDAQYTSHLRHLFQQYLNDEVLLFTTDGSSSPALTCGRVDKTFSTMDFGAGANVTDLVDMMRWHRADGPFVNSEFYPGWLDHWGQPHANVSATSVVKTLDEILAINGSVNIYMFHGGTSFGFSAGSNLGDTFQSCPTSYDYDAPLSEAGDPTPKYYMMRETIGKYLPLPSGPVPQPAAKLNIGPVQLTAKSSLFDVLLNMKSEKYRTVQSQYPLSFEDLNQPYGFVSYWTNVHMQTTDPSLLSVPNIADRGYVFAGERFQGILSREHKIDSIPVKIQKDEKLTIAVENQGRVCFGPGINDRKGIFHNVTLGTTILSNWIMMPIPMDFGSIHEIEKSAISMENTMVSSAVAPAYYTGTFTLNSSTVLDTFLRLDGWHRGVAFVNGNNLGRYWPIVGPQVTLYVPKTFLNAPPTANTLTLLELEHAPCTVLSECFAMFVDQPEINGTTPSNYNGSLPEYHGTKYLRDVSG